MSIQLPPQSWPPLVVTSDTADGPLAGEPDRVRLFNKDFWLWMQSVTAAVNSGTTPTPPTPPVVSGEVLAVDQTLTADALIAVPAVVAGDLLVIRIEQDGTGGWVATFPATVKGGPVLPTTKNTASLGCFIGTSFGTWELCGLPILGLATATDSVTPGTTGVVQSIDQVITAPATIVGPAVVPGDVLIVRVLEDGTGGWAVAFDASFGYAPAIPTTANNASLMVFFGAQTGLWELCAMPILGRVADPPTAALSGSGVLLLQVAVAGNISVTAPPFVVPGNLLVVRLAQDAIGGWLVTMGTGFQVAPTWSGAPANAVRLMMFFGATSGLWELCALIV